VPTFPEECSKSFEANGVTQPGYWRSINGTRAHGSSLTGHIDQRPAALPPVTFGGRAIWTVRHSTRRRDMAYRVYSGPRGSERVPPLEKDSWLYKEFALLDEAMSWARHVNKGDRVALLIEGDDGTPQQDGNRRRPMASRS
jgi:hypothetical protein